MKSYKDLKERKPHDPILTGNNLSYLVLAYYPKNELKNILPRGMSIPSDEVMAAKYPTAKKMDGMHPFMMMFSNCNNVHDVMTEIELRSYRELFFLFPVNYTHGNDERLCSYIPVMYLDYLLGVFGGLYLGLRKQFHPKMIDRETDTSKSFVIDGILDVSFQQTSTKDGGELDPFFTQTFKNPTLTVSYLNQTWFYTTRVYATKVLDTAHQFEWRYKGSVIKNNENTFACYSEYSFTTSQAMRYKTYFHPDALEE
jgi:hypothetical protein